MYEYRKMSREQREDLLAHRKLMQRPLHAPPHFVDGPRTYMLSAANYEHSPIMNAGDRRREFEEKLLAFATQKAQAEIFAWCVLPNHWHLLARVELDSFGKVIGRLHNGTSTQWNREDDMPGRKVWHRHADRRIRDDAHYWASVNYIHANPVRHECVKNATEWPTSSIHVYLERMGREEMVRLWSEYPVGDYGKSWDW